MTLQYSQVQTTMTSFKTCASMIKWKIFEQFKFSAFKLLSEQVSAQSLATEKDLLVIQIGWHIKHDMETSVKELSIKEQQIMEKLCQNRMSKIKVNFLGHKSLIFINHMWKN